MEEEDHRTREDLLRRLALAEQKLQVYEGIEVVKQCPLEELTGTPRIIETCIAYVQMLDSQGQTDQYSPEIIYEIAQELLQYEEGQDKNDIIEFSVAEGISETGAAGQVATGTHREAPRLAPYARNLSELIEEMQHVKIGKCKCHLPLATCFMYKDLFLYKPTKNIGTQTEEEYVIEAHQPVVIDILQEDVVEEEVEELLIEDYSEGSVQIQETFHQPVAYTKKSIVPLRLPRRKLNRTCEVCGNTYATPGSLRIHMKRHTDYLQRQKQQ